MSAGGRAPTAVKPRYGRIGALSGAALTTLVTMLGAAGIIPAGSAAAVTAQGGDGEDRGAFSLTALDGGLDVPALPQGGAAADPSSNPDDARTQASQDVSVPSDSGQGRRVVMDQSRQRVWLVDETEEGERVLRTYLVSGSLTDNLRPGSYEVYSRSHDATGIDGSSMRFMVRFTTGDNAAIGFHDIPTMEGQRMQTRAELGTPQSHGCVRQARPDAKAMWRFADVGTPVVVTA